MRGHADAETLAAFREELLSSRKAGRVSAHLAGCPRCAALDAQLAEVTSLLSHTSAAPMPDALTARIQAALAAEATARSAASAVPGSTVPGSTVPGSAVPGGAAPAGTAPGISGVPAAAPGGAARNTGGRGSGNGAAGRPARRPARERSRLALRVAAVTAAVAVIAGGGYGVARLLSPASPLATSASPASGGAASNVRNGGTMPQMGGGAGPGAAGTNRAAQSLPYGTATVPVVHSGTNYQPGRVGAQASAVLSRFGVNRSAAPAPAPSAVRLPHESSNAFPALTACVTHLSRNQTPLLVDVATYRGHPAAIIVVKGNGTSPPTALVIAPGCTATKTHILTTAPLPATP